MSLLTYNFEVEVSAEGASYLESRISVRKFDLGLAAAPFGLAVVMMEQIQKISGFWYDLALTILLCGFSCLALIAVFQLYHFQFALGVIRGNVASGAKGKHFKVRLFKSWVNRAEIFLIVAGYAIVLWLLLAMIWGYLT